MFTVANHVAHVAQTVDWFMAGAFGDGGFDMDFERLDREVRQIQSLADARAWLDRAFAAAHEQLLGKTMDELTEPLPEDGIMGGAPKLAIVSGIDDHTAHHRGALTVYSRLLDLTARALRPSNAERRPRTVSEVAGRRGRRGHQERGESVVARRRRDHERTR